MRRFNEGRRAEAEGQIVKVQVPLAGGVQARGLVYAEGRRNLVEQPLPESVIRALGEDMKGYFRAHWSGVVGWAINERVADQSW